MNGLNGNLLFLKETERKLYANKVFSARSEAETLIKHFGRMGRLDLFTGKKAIPPPARNAVRKAAAQRAGGRPLAYILKEAEFFGRRFFVNKHTLVPRPETELLVETAAGILKENYEGKSPEILDIGTGSGAVAVSLTIPRPDCRMTALDISEAALRVARKNSARYGLGKRIRFLKSDLFSAFKQARPPVKFLWDVIVSNPPYVPEEDFPQLPKDVLAEPRRALNGGPGGLCVIEKILKDAPLFLVPRGWLLMEIGDGQAKVLAEQIKSEKVFTDLHFVKDYAGIDRILVIRTSLRGAKRRSNLLGNEPRRSPRPGRCFAAKRRDSR